VSKEVSTNHARRKGYASMERMGIERVSDDIEAKHRRR